MMPVDSTEVILVRLETKLDQALKNSEDHESRLRKLESRVWLAMGAGAVGGAGGSQLLQLLIGG